MKSLTSFLLQKGVVSARILQEVLLNQSIKGGDIGVNLLEMGALSETVLVQMAGQFHRLLVVSTRTLVTAEPAVASLVDAPTAHRLGAIPFDAKGGNVYVGCFQPPPREEEPSIRKLAERTPRFFIASPVAVVLCHWMRYGIPVTARMARLIGRLYGVETDLLARAIERTGPERRGLLEAIAGGRWDEFPAALPGEAAAPEEPPRAPAPPAAAEERPEEEISSGDYEEDIFDKYIQIERIGGDSSAPPPPLGAAGPGAPPIAGARGSQVPPEGAAARGPAPVRGEVLAGILDGSGRSAGGFPLPSRGIVPKREVLARIEKAPGARALLDELAAYALQFFEFAMTLRLRKGMFEVAFAAARGWGWRVEELPLRHLDPESVPKAVMQYALPLKLAAGRGHPIEALLAQCGRGLPAEAMLLPVSVQGKVAMIIYGDNGAGGASFEAAGDLVQAAKAASTRLAQLVAEKKRPTIA